METVTLTIDGQTLTVAKGRTVLQAALDAGIDVPYYCYHPALGIEGSCRVCIVRVEKMPKLQTACSTLCADGMVVETRTPEVVQARAAVFEFLLINHPLDCPVCDKGGECPLQDFSYAFGPAGSRMDFPRRVFDGEGVKGDVDFGPTLLLNRNRCILCTRCVRFMQRVDGDAQISIQDRGNGSQIQTFQEEGVHSLISGNLMDVCPVGAITTKDYRFKSRPWDNMVAVDTLCTLCSKGCSTTAWLRAKPAWAKGPRIIRLTPRFNPDVNEYWMCDIGRFGYHFVEAGDRLSTPMVRDAAGALQPVGWHDVMVKLRETLGALGGASRAGLRFLASAHASLEEFTVLRRIATGLHGEGGERQVAVAWRTSGKKQPAATTFVVPAIDAPNLAGARDLGFQTPEDAGGAADLSGLRQAVESGAVQAVYVRRPRPVRIDRRRVVAGRSSARREGRAARGPGRPDDRPRARGRLRSARCGLPGEGRLLHERQGDRAGRRPGRGAAGGRDGGLAGPRQRGRDAGCGRDVRQLGGGACRHRGCRREQGRLRWHRRRDVRAPGRRAGSPADIEPVGTPQVGHAVQEPRGGFHSVTTAP